MSKLPKEWEEKTFDEFFNIHPKRKGLLKNDYNENGSYPIVDQGQNLISGFTNDSTLLIEIKEIPYIIFGDHTRIIKYIDFDFVVGADGTKLLTSKDNILPRFAYYHLLNKKVPSTGYNRHFKLLKDLKFYLPPTIQYQKLIVKILDHAHKIIKEREEAIKLCEQLIEAAFYEMFGDPVRNEKKLKQATLGKISEAPQYGLTTSATKNSSGTRFLRITDIDDYGFLGRTESAFVTISQKDIEKYKLNDNDIVIARTGATAGKSYLHRTTDEDIVFASYLIRFPLKTNLILPEFVEAFFQTSFYNEQIKRLSTGTARENVNANTLKKIKIPFPERKDQEKFVELINKNRKFKISMQDALKLEKQQFQALLQAAFEGKLTAHLDGEDE